MVGSCEIYVVVVKEICSWFKSNKGRRNMGTSKEAKAFFTVCFKWMGMRWRFVL